MESTYFESVTLTCEPSKIEPNHWRGLWFCRDIYDVSEIGLNAVCMPMDRERDWDLLSKNKKFIEQFRFVFVVCAEEEYRNELVEALRRRVTTKILVTDPKRFMGCRNVAELQIHYGDEGVAKLMLDYTTAPAYGLLDIASIEQPDIEKLPRVLSGFSSLDRALGGFLMGDVSIWTGKRGEGKSTFLSQLMLDAIDNGHRACVYSGELSAWRFKYWLQLQAAGSNNISQHEDRFAERTVYTVPKPTRDVIDEWWRGSLQLYDTTIESAHDEDSILSLFKYAARQYGCDVFLVDNIMTARFSQKNDKDFYRAQSAFVGRLVEFAIQLNVHVHVVAHPRKTDNKGIADADDISGTGDIANRAANVFSLKRLTEIESKDLGFDTSVHILKDRMYGTKAKLGFKFDPISRRYYQVYDENNKQYGWELMKQAKFTEANEVTPFE